MKTTEIRVLGGRESRGGERAGIPSSSASTSASASGFASRAENKNLIQSAKVAIKSFSFGGNKLIT